VLAPVTPERPELALPAAHNTREARLRPEQAHRYPWIRPGEWQPAAILADRVLAGHLLRGREDVIWGRVLVEGHFEFRGGSARAGERAVIRP
jgi:hypothetical protein